MQIINNDEDNDGINLRQWIFWGAIAISITLYIAYKIKKYTNM